MRTFWIVLLSVLMLSGCGQKPPIPTPPADPPAPARETPAGPEEPTVPETAPSRPEKTDVVFTVEGEEEIVPCTLYTGEGYSLYLPDEDWPAPTHSEDGGVPTEQWVSIYNDDVWLKVSYYQGMTAPEAREEFARSSGAEFEDLMGGEPGDPLTAIYPAKHFLSFISVEDGTSGAYILSWQVSFEAAEGYGVRLDTIVSTFEVDS